jgi:hypothetical protein
VSSVLQQPACTQALLAAVNQHLQAVAQRQAIEDFLAAGSSLLNLQASSSEEIGQAGQEARRLVTQLGEVAQVSLVAESDSLTSVAHWHMALPHC